MTKKGYQKRLPTVLPAATPTSIPPPVPAPRTPTEDETEDVRLVETREEARVAPPPAGTTRPQTANASLRPARPRPSLTKVVAVGLAILASPLVGALLASTLVEDPDRTGGRGPGIARDAGLPVRPSPDQSYVVSEVLPSGDVVVRQRIRAVRPMQMLRLELPLAPAAAGVSARQIDIVADGYAVVGPATITDEFATYTFFPATDVRIRYQLTGAVEFSESRPGRALAVVTTLDVRYAPRVERETRVVRAAEVLALACSRSVEEAPVPCGEPGGDGRWQVELTGRRVLDRVVAQVNLG